jgi:hypothetical protein
MFKWLREVFSNLWGAVEKGFSVFVDGVGAALVDIRQRVLEEGYFGKIVTPRTHSITIGSPGEQFPGEPTTGFWRNDLAPHSTNHDRDAAANEHKAPERGIDL